MNANEAPEKLYILFNHPYTVDYTKLNKRRCEEEVEYTRTDAFIEKACEFFKCFADDNGMVEEELSHITETLKNYLKGE